MPRSERDESWVIYRSVNKSMLVGLQAVCEQKEWEAMERDHPGAQTLVLGGIGNEGEAERMARGTSGNSKPRGVAKFRK